MADCNFGDIEVRFGVAKAKYGFGVGFLEHGRSIYLVPVVIIDCRHSFAYRVPAADHVRDWVAARVSIHAP